MKLKKTKIRYLDGKRLKNAIVAGGRLIQKMQDQLDKINVFPVPDGDTGTNMALTMNQISTDLASSSEKSISSVSTTLADAALNGAQGNSGAILAQFFYGFAEGVKGNIKLTTETFANAVQNAKTAAYQALAEPQEGTIVTVISEWANYIQKTAHKTDDFSELFKSSLFRAKQALADTPKKLDVLKKHGVVDAGAQGFVHLLEGIVAFIERGKIKNLVQSEQTQPRKLSIPAKNIELKYQYCTECILKKSRFNLDQIKNSIREMGDSLIVAGGREKVRIHIHTNNPDRIFSTLATFGSVSNKKVDDMKKQQGDQLSALTIGRIGIVTDSSCDLPEEFLIRNHIHVIPMRIIFGQDIYLDKVDLSPKEFYEKLQSSTLMPKTSQPAISDIKNTYEQTVPFYDKIISIHIPKVVSGSFQAIQKIAETYGDRKVTCIDGKNISCALGFAVMEAVSAIKQNLSVEAVVNRVDQAVENIHMFVSLPSVDNLIKGGRLKKPVGWIAKFMHLSPVVALNDQGKVYLADKAIGHKSAMKKVIKKIVTVAKKYRRVKFMVAHANGTEAANWYVNQIKLELNIKEDIPILDAAPVLGVHAGVGAAGVALIGYND